MTHIYTLSDIQLHTIYLILYQVAGYIFSALKICGSLASDLIDFPFQTYWNLLGAAIKDLEKGYSFLLNLFRRIKTIFEYEHHEFLILHFKTAKSHELSLKLNKSHKCFSIWKHRIQRDIFIFFLNEYCINWLHMERYQNVPLIYHWEKVRMYI